MKWRSKLLLYPCSIQPRAGYAFPNEADQASDPRVFDDFGKFLRVSGHNIEHMAQLHQIVVALHDLPLIGEAVLVLIAMMFFHQKARLDGPTGARTQAASLVQVKIVERLTGYPQMPRALFNDLRAPFFGLKQVRFRSPYDSVQRADE